jgi:hypothetical protein
MLKKQESHQKQLVAKPYKVSEMDVKGKCVKCVLFVPVVKKHSCSK